MKTLTNIAKFIWRVSLFPGITLILGIVLLHSHSPLILRGPPAHIPIVHKTKSPEQINSSSKDVLLKMSNVHFRISEKLALDVDNLSARLIPSGPQGVVNFDDINGFEIKIHRGEVRLKPAVLTNLFNDIVLNYEDAPLRKIKIQFVQLMTGGENQPVLKLNGEMKLGFWLDFEMLADIEVNQEDNTLVISALTIKTLKIPYIKELMGAMGMKLDSVLSIAGGRGIIIKGNQIILSPFEIFPPPALSGIMAHTRVDPSSDSLLLSFKPGSGNELLLGGPPAGVENYLMLKKGKVAFRKLIMQNSDILMLDRNRKDSFDFFLARYWEVLKRGDVYIRPDSSILVKMPDYEVISGLKRVE